MKRKGVNVLGVEKVSTNKDNIDYFNRKKLARDHENVNSLRKIQMTNKIKTLSLVNSFKNAN